MEHRTVTLDEMELGGSGPHTSDASTSTRRDSYASNVDSEGFVVPSIRWKRAGDPYNRSVMERLKKEQPILYKSMVYRKWDKKNFPGLQYGKAYFKRGVPGSWSMNTFGKSWSEATPEQRSARSRMGYRGYGNYVSNVGYSGRGALWGKALGGIGGRMLGSRIGLGREGGLIGAKLGDMASDSIEKYFRGRGAYIGADNTLGNYPSEENQLINKMQGSRHMVTKNDETNAITICHTEYIGDVKPEDNGSSLSSGFQTQYFLALNPGLALSFPWLSNIAQFYEEYEFEQLMFTYKSMVTEGNATAGGTVIMATQYNPMNPAFLSKQTMENYDYANSGKVTSTIQHGIECDPAKRGGNAIEYVRTGAIPSNQDLKTYDHAVFQLATTGAQSGQTLGELWVHYKVTLHKTKIPMVGQISRNLNAFADYAPANSLGVIGPPGVGLDANAPFTIASGGSRKLVTSTVDNYSNPNIELSFTVNSITLPRQIVSGTYIVVYTASGSTSDVSGYSMAIDFTNSNGIDDFLSGVVTQSVISGSDSPTGESHISVFKVVVNNATSSSTRIGFTSPAYAGGNCDWKLQLYQVSSSI